MTVENHVSGNETTKKLENKISQGNLELKDIKEIIGKPKQREQLKKSFEKIPDESKNKLITSLKSSLGNDFKRSDIAKTYAVQIIGKLEKKYEGKLDGSWGQDTEKAFKEMFSDKKADGVGKGKGGNLNVKYSEIRPVEKQVVEKPVVAIKLPVESPENSDFLEEETKAYKGLCIDYLDLLNKKLEIKPGDLNKIKEIINGIKDNKEIRELSDKMKILKNNNINNKEVITKLNEIFKLNLELKGKNFEKPNYDKDILKKLQEYLPSDIIDLSTAGGKIYLKNKKGEQIWVCEEGEKIVKKGDSTTISNEKDGETITIGKKKGEFEIKINDVANNFPISYSMDYKKTSKENLLSNIDLVKKQFGEGKYGIFLGRINYALKVEDGNLISKSLSDGREESFNKEKGNWEVYKPKEKTKNESEPVTESKSTEPKSAPVKELKTKLEQKEQLPEIQDLGKDIASLLGVKGSRILNDEEKTNAFNAYKKLNDTQKSFIKSLKKEDYNTVVNAINSDDFKNLAKNSNNDRLDKVIKKETAESVKLPETPEVLKNECKKIIDDNKVKLGLNNEGYNQIIKVIATYPADKIVGLKSFLVSNIESKDFLSKLMQQHDFYELGQKKENQGDIIKKYGLDKKDDKGRIILDLSKLYDVTEKNDIIKTIIDNGNDGIVFKIGKKDYLIKKEDINYNKFEVKKIIGNVLALGDYVDNSVFKKYEV